MATNEVRLQQNNKNGQFSSTHPKTIIEALGWRKGDKLEYILHNGDLIIRRVK